MKEITYEFVNDVVAALAAQTPGPWFHMGGDEVETLTEEEYATFVRRVADIIRSHGRQLVGWDEIAATGLAEDAVVQLWRPLLGRPLDELSEERQEAGSALEESVRAAVADGAGFILSPADRIYLDMKYDSTTAIGLTWAGVTDERTAYDWVVGERFHMIPESSILGVEGPIWSETIASVHDMEYLAFPRLTAVAEIGWSPEEARDWNDYRYRLAAQAPRWRAQGVNFRRSPEIDWQDR